MKPKPRNLDSGRTLEVWESWVDLAIRDARDRGDFDNLPGDGKPLNLERNPLAGDREMGFHVLKNASLLPRWMELDRELAKALSGLESFREQSAVRLNRLRDRARAQSTPSRPGPPDPTVLRWLRGDRPTWPGSQPSLSFASVERERLHTRRQYLERAAVVNTLITEYNAALPDEIRWLERARLSPEQAAARFDAACPAVVHGTIDEA